MINSFNSVSKTGYFNKTSNTSPIFPFMKTNKNSSNNIFNMEFTTNSNNMHAKKSELNKFSFKNDKFFHPNDPPKISIPSFSEEAEDSCIDFKSKLIDADKNRNLLKKKRNHDESNPEESQSQYNFYKIKNLNLTICNSTLCQETLESSSNKGQRRRRSDHMKINRIRFRSKSKNKNSFKSDVNYKNLYWIKNSNKAIKLIEAPDCYDDSNPYFKLGSDPNSNINVRNFNDSGKQFRFRAFRNVNKNMIINSTIGKKSIKICRVLERLFIQCFESMSKTIVDGDKFQKFWLERFDYSTDVKIDLDYLFRDFKVPEENIPYNLEEKPEFIDFCNDYDNSHKSKNNNNLLGIDPMESIYDLAKKMFDLTKSYSSNELTVDQTNKENEILRGIHDLNSFVEKLPIFNIPIGKSYFDYRIQSQSVNDLNLIKPNKRTSCELDVDPDEMLYEDKIQRKTPLFKIESNVECTKSLVKSDTLKNKFRCEFCSEVFGTGYALGGHKSRKHPNQSTKYAKKLEIRNKREDKRALILEGKKELLRRYSLDYDKLLDQLNGKKTIKTLVRRYHVEYSKIIRDLKRKSSMYSSNIDASKSCTSNLGNDRMKQDYISYLTFDQDSSDKDYSSVDDGDLKN